MNLAMVMKVLKYPIPIIRDDMVLWEPSPEGV